MFGIFCDEAFGLTVRNTSGRDRIDANTVITEERSKIFSQHDSGAFDSGIFRGDGHFRPFVYIKPWRDDPVDGSEKYDRTALLLLHQRRKRFHDRKTSSDLKRKICEHVMYFSIGERAAKVFGFWICRIHDPVRLTDTH